MRQALLALSVLSVALTVVRPVWAEKITRQHRDYPVLQLVQTKRSTLAQLDESCRQAEQIRECTQLVSDLSQPLLPALDAIAQSEVLNAMARIPGVDTPVEVIQGAAVALRAALGLLAWVNRTDQEYEAPIRDAILKSNQLLRSQDSRDVPPLMDSYRAGCEACVRIENRLVAAEGQLTKAIRLVSLSATVLDRLGESSVDNDRSARELVEQLQQLQKGMGLLLTQVREGRLFMQQVLTAGGSANTAETVTDASRDAFRSGRGGGSSAESTVAPPRAEALQEVSTPTDQTTVPPPPQGMAAPTPYPAPTTVLPYRRPEPPSVANAHTAYPSPQSGRAGNPGLILVLSALPGIAALLAIAWMIYNYYVLVPRRLQDALPALSADGSINHMATLRLGGRQMFIPCGQPVLIGSNAGRASIYIDDPAVSAVHAKIEFIRGNWWVTDLGSTHGTFIDGQAVTQAVISHGQHLRLGSSEMVLTVPGRGSAAYG